MSSDGFSLGYLGYETIVARIRSAVDGRAKIKASLHLDAEPRSAARARRFVELAIGDSEEERTLDIVKLLTSEVVTNAILHSGSDIELTLERAMSAIRVEVTDGTSVFPERRPYDPEAIHGRGLPLLDCLALRWGVEERELGKVVWFEIESQVRSEESATVEDINNHGFSSS